jgi:ABC-type glycerol-3-phosphate transport system permease component
MDTTVTSENTMNSTPYKKSFFTRKRIINGIRIFFCYAILIAVTIFCIFPIAWIIKTAVETPQFIRNPQIQWIPLKSTLENFTQVLQDPRAMVGRSFMNSLIVAGISTLLSTLITVLAAYAISRFNFIGKNFFAIYLLMINMVPATLILISMFIFLVKIKLVNSHPGLIIYYTAIGLPLAIWMLKSYFDTIPIDLEEQAMIDGATRLQAIRHIILPLALPGIVSVTVYVFMTHWNEFMAALTIVQKQELRTLPVQIINFVGFERNEWGPMMAFSVIISIPAVVLFVFAQKHLVGGLTAGYTK